MTSVTDEDLYTNALATLLLTSLAPLSSILGAKLLNKLIRHTSPDRTTIYEWLLFAVIGIYLLILSTVLWFGNIQPMIRMLDALKSYYAPQTGDDY
ncbi:hypothetical protein N7540_012776 [Penicillium herquei]|nr:hypothetical protein N7540_012776 [Penicillium herquei]